MKCKHGMLEEQCSFCTPTRRTIVKTHHVPLKDKETGELYFARMKTSRVVYR